MVVRWSRLAVALVLLIGAYAIVPVSVTVEAGPLLRLASVAVLLLGAGGVTVRQLRLSLDDSDRHVDGLVLAVTLITVAFATVFHALETHHPGQVAGLDTKVDAFYFTLSTMLTVGYGDIHAQGQAARVLVVVQMVFDVVLVAAAATVLSSRVKRAAATRRGGTPPAAG